MDNFYFFPNTCIFHGKCNLFFNKTSSFLTDVFVLTRFFLRNNPLRTHSQQISPSLAFSSLFSRGKIAPPRRAVFGDDGYDWQDTPHRGRHQAVSSLKESTENSGIGFYLHVRKAFLLVLKVSNANKPFFDIRLPGGYQGGDAKM